MPSYLSQGAQLRRQSTAAGSTAQTVAATIAFSSAAGTITRSDVGSFVTDGFSTGMRMVTDSSANSTRVLTAAAVAATVITVYEPITDQSTGTSITLTGYSMVAVGQVTGFSGPSGSVSVIDITHLGSTAKEKMVGVKDDGQVSFDIIFDTNATALHTALRTDLASRTKRIYDIQLTDYGTVSSQPTAFYFDAYPVNFGLQGAVDDAVKGSVTLEVTSSIKTIDAV